MAFLEKLPDSISRIRENTKAKLLQLVREDPNLSGMGAKYSPTELQEGDVISSSRFSFEQNALYETFRSIYSQVATIDATRQRHENVISEVFRKTRAAILKAINDVRSYSFLQHNPAFDEVRFIDFSTSRNLTGLGPAAFISPESRSLGLALSSKRQAPITRSRGQVKINITHYGGGTSGSLIQDFNPERMVDNDDNTFWADVILTDGPISQLYSKSSGEEKECRGVVSEVEISLAESTSINTVRVLPFGEFPMSVIDVAYKDSPNSTSWHPIEGFKERLPDLDWHELSFPPVQASIIKVTLLQENYVSGIYHFPERLVYNTDLLEHTVAQAYLDRVGTSAISDPEVAQVAATPELLGVLEALSEFQAEVTSTRMPEGRVREQELSQALLVNISKVLSRPNQADAVDMLEPAGLYAPEKPEELLEVNTTEYMVGIRTLEASLDSYAPVSYYASPQFSPASTPVEASIIVDERHSELSDEIDEAYRLTSVEYDFDFGEGFRKPIFPANLGASEDEIVFLDRHTKIGYTRFEPSSVSVSVRKNGVRLKPSQYTFVVDGGRDLGQLTILEEFSPTAVYTVTYIPTSASNKIDLPSVASSTKVRVPEAFDGTDTNSHVQTKYIPYVAYEVLNDDITFMRSTDGDGIWEYRLSAGSVTADGVTYSSANITYEPVTVLVDNVKAKNITNYSSEDLPVFTESDPKSRLFEYFHVGRDFYFNTNIHGQQIFIEYNWLAQHVQLISALRCFKQSGINLTPKINSYKIRLRTSPL